MDELVTLRREAIELDAKCLHLEKEKERVTMEALLERETFKRRLAFLREQNRRLEDTSTILNLECFNDVDALKSKISEFEGLVIS